MPATLKVVQSPQISVRDLSNMERTVALYASDMPTTYRHRLSDDALGRLH
ncbi:hypothetical protein [Streptomyces sp. NBC_01296]|nr:hypothetical protein OG299_18695 [Streptomyces sp. NBC_01296]